MTDEHARVVILLAEDDEEDRMLTIEALTANRLSNEIHCVEDGDELMDYLHCRGKYSLRDCAPTPGLILLDLNMPRMDGRQALLEIKGDVNLQHIPVVVLTTSQEEEDIYRSYDGGANSFITKPASFAALQTLMKELSRYWFELVELPQAKPNKLIQ